MTKLEFAYQTISKMDDKIKKLESGLKSQQPVTPLASKEVKSAEEILDITVRNTDFNGKKYTNFNNATYWRDGVEKSIILEAMHAFAAQHQQSEGMVDVEKVVAVVNKFFDKSTTSMNAIAFLIEDIRALTNPHQPDQQLTQNDNAN